MKRDHYIIPICSPSAPVSHAICCLTHLAKFSGLQFIFPRPAEMKPGFFFFFSSSSLFSASSRSFIAFNCLRGFN